MSEHTPRKVATAEVTMGETHYAVSIRTGIHDLTGDEPKPEGGDAGPSPFGFVLSGLGACTAITLRMYAERKAWPLAALRIELSYRWEGEGAERRGYVERTIHVEGPLDAEQRARLAEIAEKTPVTRALKSGIAIRTTLS